MYKERWIVMQAAILLLGIILFPWRDLQAAPETMVAPNERCSVCGMFVAKYDNWVVQVRMADDTVKFFDGVKDMLVFYFNPHQFGDAVQEDIREIWVKDYYSLRWQDGRDALYVVGSDVYGPMGKEFIPLVSREAAENFKKDHGGEKILTLSEITEELVDSMRSGSRMRHTDR